MQSVRFIAVWAMAICACAAEPGLSISRDGKFVRHGAPYAAIGVNYFDLFHHLLSDSSDRGFERDLQRLAGAGIPFVRFAAGGFWPKDYELYLQNRAEYFRRMDRVVRAAEAAGIGLIPTLFWQIAAIPDLSGEPVSAWGDRNSRTVRFMRTYTREMVRRYGRSEAIWMWEFCNEWNDYFDLRDPRHRPAVVPHLGTARSRTERDDISLNTMTTAYTEFVREVRKHDCSRAISSGNNLPRESAGQRADRESGADTRNDWAAALLKQNAAFPLISVHLYMNGATYFVDASEAVPQFTEFLERIGYAARKPVFAGEFGSTADTYSQRKREFEALLDSIESAGIPLAAVWNFGPRALGGDGVNRNIYFDNESEWMLNEVSCANARLRSTAPVPR